MCSFASRDRVNISSTIQHNSKTNDCMCVFERETEGDEKEIKREREGEKEREREREREGEKEREREGGRERERERERGRERERERGRRRDKRGKGREGGICSIICQPLLWLHLYCWSDQR